MEFPAKTTKSRRRRRHLNADSQAVSLPIEQQQAITEHANGPEASSTEPSVSVLTPATSTAPSEAAAIPRQGSETAAAPPQQRSRTNTATSATSTATNRPATRSSAVPVPALPSLPKANTKDAKPVQAEKPVNGDVATESAPEEATVTEPSEKPAESESAPAARAPPSSWAKLFSKPASAAAAKADVANGTVPADTAVNGHSTNGVVGTPNGSAPSFSKTNANSVAEAINSFQVGLANEVSFLEPRGLINTGNMCYMNSVSPHLIIFIVEN
jgi:ubiquitin carboxyl-terminal hydrolase 10